MHYGLTKYVNQYKRAMKHRDNPRSKNILKYRSLKYFLLCGWIFQLIALVSFNKGIIMPFDRMICSQETRRGISLPLRILTFLHGMTFSMTLTF